MGNQRGQCVKGDNCSFRHDMDKRGKSSPSNPSQNSFMQQSERKPSRPRGKSPSGRMSRWPCKDYLKGTCNNSSCHLLSITLLLRKISPESINLERKFYLDCSSDTLSTRGEFGRVTYWSQILRSWRRWTHRKSTRKDSMRKR